MRPIGNEYPRPTLAELKIQAYWIRYILHHPEELENPPVLFKGLRSLERSKLVRILEKVISIRQSKKPDPYWDSQYTLKQMKTALHEGSIADVLEDSFEEHATLLLRVYPLLFHSLVEGLKSNAKKISMADDPLALRLGQLRALMGLNEIEEELLLFAYLRKTEFESGMILDRNVYVDKADLSILLDHPFEAVEEAVAENALLRRLVLIDEEGNLAHEIFVFLDRSKGCLSWRQKSSILALYEGV